MSTSNDPDPSRPHRGRFRRWVGGLLRRWIDPKDQPATTPAPDLPVTSTVNKVETIEFETPSKGDAYNFNLSVDLCFCATGQLSRAELDARIAGRLADIKSALKAAARPIAREYPVFRPGIAEPDIAAAVQKAVTNALTGVPDEQGVVLTCSTRVRVNMPGEVRALQRLAVAEQVKFEARYEQSEQSAQRLGELREVWYKFIRDGLSRWETPYAVLMAQNPAQVASALFTMRDDRRQEATKLVDVVSAVAHGHERMDLLEFALATDSALRKTYELMNIALPDTDAPKSTFDAEPEAKV